MKQKTEQELQQNYERFIAIVKKYFTGDRLEKLLFMYSENELGVNLAISPASGNAGYHNCYTGGYIDHIFNVCKNALKVKELFVSMGGKVDFTDEKDGVKKVEIKFRDFGNNTTQPEVKWNSIKRPKV